MNKIRFISVLLVFFQATQATLHAEDYSASKAAGGSEAERKISEPAVGSQYNLDGMQTRDGQYKSSYSTKSIDDRNASKGQQAYERQRNQRSGTGLIPGTVSNPDGLGVIIVIDE